MFLEKINRTSNDLRFALILAFTLIQGIGSEPDSPISEIPETMPEAVIFQEISS